MVPKKHRERKPAIQAITKNLAKFIPNSAIPIIISC